MDEREKLKQLLEHWIEHNEEHAAEFREWAVKAKDLGEADISDQLLEAANQIERSNEILGQASAKMKSS
ncbi:MAG: hypothetical protein R6U37_09695 [Dehalococcoidia bacterium]